MYLPPALTAVGNSQKQAILSVTLIPTARLYPT